MTTISANFVRPDESNKVQSLVKDRGKHTLIDKVKVRYLSDDDKHCTKNDVEHAAVLAAENDWRDANVIIADRVI